MGAFSVYFDDADGRKGEGLSVGVVCRGEKGEWVKGIVDGVWSVGSSLLRGSKELSAACGLSGQVCCVGQGNCRRRVVCRVKYGEWVKRIVGGVWSVGAKMLRGSKKLATGVVCRRENGEWVKRPVGGCGLSARKRRVGQENCRRRVVCRREKGEWVKEIGDGCGLSARKRRVNQRNHTYRMPQTLQIATQIKIAKTLKT